MATVKCINRFRRYIFLILLISIISMSNQRHSMEPPFLYYRSVMNLMKRQFKSEYIKNFIDSLQTELFPSNRGRIVRIVGGKEADIRSFPYHISLAWPENDGYSCGGILITPSHVLTAAHCVIMKNGWHVTPENILLIPGRSYLNETGEIRNTKKITPHPKYVITTKQNDIAVVEATEPFALGDRVNTISLIDHRVTPLTLCTTIGFGAASSTGPVTSNHLMRVNVPIHSMLRCRLSYFKRVKIYEGMMCAGYFTGSRDACAGDSGGPLVCEQKLAGIVSAGVDCGVFYNPGIYTDVFYYYPFIKSVVGDLLSTPEVSSPQNNTVKMLKNWINSRRFAPLTDVGLNRKSNISEKNQCCKCND